MSAMVKRLRGPQECPPEIRLPLFSDIITHREQMACWGPVFDTADGTGWTKVNQHRSISNRLA